VGTALACYSLKFVRTVLFVNFAYDKIFGVYKNTLVNSTPGFPTGRGTLEESYVYLDMCRFARCRYFLTFSTLFARGSSDWLPVPV